MTPYDVLGVAPDASDEDVSKAYKRLARRYHPDLHPGDDEAARMMGVINRAYDDVKAQRRRGETEAFSRDANDPFDGPMGSYQSCCRRPRRFPAGLFFAALVVFFLVRLLLSSLFGGFAGYGSYYFSNGHVNGPRNGIIPGYGYFMTMPDQEN